MATPHVRQVWTGPGIDRVKTILDAEERARNGSPTIIHDHGYSGPCRDSCYELSYDGDEIRLDTSKVSLGGPPPPPDFTKLRRHLAEMREVFFALANGILSSNDLYTYDAERADFTGAYLDAVEEIDELCS